MSKLTEAQQTIAEMQEKISELVAASQAALELVSIVTADRDALAVTVNKFSSIRKEWGGLVTNDMRTLTAFIELSNETPQVNLAAHDAEVAANAVDGFISDIGYLDGLTPQCIFKQAREYSAKLRAKAKP